MSAEYLNMTHIAQDGDCPDPTKPPPVGRKPKPDKEDESQPTARPPPRKLSRKR